MKKKLKSKTIGILTSGGDAPGMNAVIYTITKIALSQGIKILGIKNGYKGLIDGDIMELNLNMVSYIANRGGTILYTTRNKDFKTVEGLKKASSVCEKFNIDYLIVIGGDGSLKGAQELSNYGVSCIVIPATIDNDVNCSEYTIGYDTAMNTAIQIIDKIVETSCSNGNERCNLIEVMGRNCGNIALSIGIAVDADIILVPEVNFDLNNDIINKILDFKKLGKKHPLIIVSEGIKNVNKISDYIENQSGIETRYTVLGYAQRGGSPSIKDRVIAFKIGLYAMDLIEKNIKNRIVILNNNKITDLDLNEAVNVKKFFDYELYNSISKSNFLKNKKNKELKNKTNRREENNTFLK